MDLLDYRELDESEPYDKIASVGMFEHVGRASCRSYFAKIHRLLKPGGLLLNHGITAGGTRNHQLGAGLGDFIERYIFPGGELSTSRTCSRRWPTRGLEAVDVESLRPHYASTLWAWSDALEAQLDERAHGDDATPWCAPTGSTSPAARCASSSGWLSLSRCSAPGAPATSRTARCAAHNRVPVQSRLHVPAALSPYDVRFKSKADGDLIMMGPAGDQVLRIIGREPAPQGIIEVAALPARSPRSSGRCAADEAARRPRPSAARARAARDAVACASAPGRCSR